MTIEEIMRWFGLDWLTAKFVVAIEEGRIKGDVFPPRPYEREEKREK